LRSAARAGLVALLALVGACSGARPELVTPTTGAAGVPPVTTAATVPPREDCDTAIGPGPWRIGLSADSPPCVVVAAHQRLGLFNQTGRQLDLPLGISNVSLPIDGSMDTVAVGTILSPGANRLADATGPVGTVWLVDPAENTLAGASIGLTSIGPVELGQNPGDVTAAAGVPVPAAGSACYQAGFRGDPYSPQFTFRDGSLVVVQVFTPGLATLSGVAVGSTAADIQAAYGDRVTAQPAPDGNPARELWVFLPSDEVDQVYRLVFDLTDGVVTSVRFGAAEIVADQPGCG
jgi:hypothetical protein